MAAGRLQRLFEKREAVNARIKREQSRLKTTERRSDTRRKILVGAAVLEKASQDAEFSAFLTKELEAFLVRDGDRALFRLAPLAPKEND